MLLMGCQAVQAVRSPCPCPPCPFPPPLSPPVLTTMPLPLQGKPPPSRWVKPGSAGAGYASKKLRVPKWEPKWDMPGSTVVSSAACCLLLPTL